MSTITFTINGERQIVDLDEELEIREPETERAKNAAKIAHWGSVLAAAEKDMEVAEAELDHLKAGLVLRGANEGVSEWKAKAAAEASADFHKLNLRLIALRQNAKNVRSVHNGFLKKHDMLLREERRERAERPSSHDLGRDHSGDSRWDEYRKRREAQRKGQQEE